MTQGTEQQPGRGWEYVHVCIDDASRIAYAEIRKVAQASAIAFLKAAVIYYAKLGISNSAS